MDDTDSCSSNSTATREVDPQTMLSLPHTREKLLEKARISLPSAGNLKSSGIKSPTKGEGFKLMAHLALLPRASQLGRGFDEGYSPLW